MKDISERLAALSVAHLCDACMRVGTDIRLGPPLAPILPGQRTQGRVRPVRHYGSVDVFLEALERGAAGEVLVIDNEGRDDEGCIGDLTALEVQRAGLAGIIVWGRHRDTAILRTLAIPLFSRGAYASGPVRLDPRPAETFASAELGDQLATGEDWIVADDDGVILVHASLVEAVVEAAEAIRDVETRQAALMAEGVSLREQLRFADYLDGRARDPALDFRTYLRGLSAAIEE